MTTGHPKDSDYIKQSTSIEEAAEEHYPIKKEQLQPFLKWVFLKADRIYVEHTLGWRDEAIKELYEAYLKQDKK